MVKLYNIDRQVWRMENQSNDFTWAYVCQKRVEPPVVVL